MTAKLSPFPPDFPLGEREGWEVGECPRAGTGVNGCHLLYWGVWCREEKRNRTDILINQIKYFF